MTLRRGSDHVRARPTRRLEQIDLCLVIAGRDAQVRAEETREMAGRRKPQLVRHIPTGSAVWVNLWTAASKRSTLAYTQWRHRVSR